MSPVTCLGHNILFSPLATGLPAISSHTWGSVSRQRCHTPVPPLSTSSLFLPACTGLLCPEPCMAEPLSVNSGPAGPGQAQSPAASAASPSQRPPSYAPSPMIRPGFSLLLHFAFGITHLLQTCSKFHFSPRCPWPGPSVCSQRTRAQFQNLILWPCPHPLSYDLIPTLPRD